MYLISGDVRYFVENQVYDAAPGDVFITNHNEIHKPSFKTAEPYERITVVFDPAFISHFSTDRFDLLSCFYNRKNGTGNRITLSAEQDGEIRAIFDKIEREYECAEDSRDIKISALMLELLILINKASKGVDDNGGGDICELVTEVINYVNENIDGDLSLEALERVFYISGAHLCRSFKSETGITLHKFIIKKRIARASRLLAENASVTEAMHASGFSDFSNFIRTFKKYTGKTPGRYRKEHDELRLQATGSIGKSSKNTPIGNNKND